MTDPVPIPSRRPLPLPISAALAVGATVLAATFSTTPPAAALGTLASPAAEGADLEVRVTETAPPSMVPDSLAGALRQRATAVTEGDRTVMEIWWARQLPGGNDGDGSDVAYGSIPAGALLGVMRLPVERVDFRDQSVPSGTYVMRYLRQPVDGKHIGVTTYRDFAVLNRVQGSGDPEPAGFDAVLGRALMLNTHPYVWALWPADEAVSAAGEEGPGLVTVEDKSLVTVALDRPGAEPLTLAMVVEGVAPSTSYIY